MLKDKIVFITGASSGIGAACAEYFAKSQSKLLLCARSVDSLKLIAKKLQAQYDVEIHVMKLDVRQYSEVNDSIHALPEKWKKIDILINNAGLASGLDFLHEGQVEDWDSMIDTNVKGLLYVTKVVLPWMVMRNSGHIFNIGSIAGHEIYPKGAVYCATKHAVKALSQGLRMDVFGTNIRVTSIDPGMVKTNFSNVRFHGDTKRAKAVYEGFQALMPEDIADAILYCASCPPHVNISEMLIMPTAQASVSMVTRNLSIG